MKICFIGKLDKPYIDNSINHINKISKDVDIYDSSLSNLFPKKILDNKYDIIISYISNWIIPKVALQETKRWNINFHPGPPEYPGTGCFNFAIYDSAENYGATVHIMDPLVDTGKIISVKRFPLDMQDTVEALSVKTYKVLSDMFVELMNFINENDSLPVTKEVWKRKPYKRSELESLATIDASMSKEEIEKRIKATYYPGKPAPFININGKRFEYNPNR